MNTLNKVKQTKARRIKWAATNVKERVAWMLKRRSSVPINPAPLIVLGHQKSGTSAIASLLAKATRKTATVDFFYKRNSSMPLFRSQLYSGRLPFDAFIARNSRDLSADIIKEPELTFYYDKLEETFPQATYVFVIREPKATIKSVLDRLKLPGHLPTLDERHYQQVDPLTGWLPALQGRAPDGPGENYIERLAHRWNIAAQTYLNASHNMVLVKYEDFKRKKENTIYDLAEKVGLEIQSSISQDVDVPFQPRGNHGVTVAEFFSEENKRKINDICREQALAFSYDI
ncbi:MAG: sulfotransferase [Phormidesmis sp.]